MKTRWHITFGTYGTRVHGGAKPTITRERNRLGEPQMIDVPALERFERDLMCGDPVLLSMAQRLFLQAVVPRVCERGGWDLVACAAASNHVHVVVDVDPRIHGKQVRPLLQRWLSQVLNERWPQPSRPDGGVWWAEAGSARAVRGSEYLEIVKEYVERQRAVEKVREAPRGGDAPAHH